MTEKACQRCGSPTPTRDNIEDTTSYYGFQIKTRTETTVTRTIRLIIWSIYGRDSKRGRRLGGADILRADEEQPLCDDCGGLLIGRFMQGRSVPALAGKEER